MKKYFKLLLFFLCLLFQLLFVHKIVMAKEIKYEMRGAYLCLNTINLDKEFNLIDFKNYITQSYDDFKDSGFNTIFVDISWFIDLNITGKFNDLHKGALEVIVKEGSKRSLDIHGTFSDFHLKGVEIGNLEEYLISLSDESFIKDKLDCIIKFNDMYYLDPGVHEVRDYLINVIVDIGTKYKFDGIYLDGIIYPKNIDKYTFNDSYSFNTYNEDKLSKENFRRQNVNDFVKVLGDKFKSYKSELKFGIGVNYIWRTFKDDFNGINYEGYSDYDKGAFDSLNIGKKGYVNYIVIKIDNSISEISDIESIMCWWEKKFRTHLIDVFVQGEDNILNVITATRNNSFINGFLCKSFEDVDEFRGIMTTKAVIPRFKSFDSYYSLCDFKITPKVIGNKIEFNILDEGYENTKNILVYKFPYDDLDTENGEYIKDILPSDGLRTNITLNKEDGVYAITKLNYNSIENKIICAFIVNEEFGLIEGKFTDDKPKIINSNIEFMVKSYNKNNEFKFILEKDGNEILEGDFDKNGVYTFIPDDSGIYRLNVIISNRKNKENILKSYLSFEVKDKYIVVLDAGHGGDEPGAKTQEDILEKDINLSICNYTSNLATDNEKISIRNTRINDIKIDLSDRVKLCSFLGGDIFISIHQNAFDNESANGIETYHYFKENYSKNLCNLIQKNLIDNTNAFDRGVKTSNFVVLRENIVPSVLVECGFITNKDESNNLVDDLYQKNISEAIYESIISYLSI